MVRAQRRRRPRADRPAAARSIPAPSVPPGTARRAARAARACSSGCSRRTPRRCCRARGSSRPTTAFARRSRATTARPSPPPRSRTTARDSVRASRYAGAPSLRRARRAVRRPRRTRSTGRHGWSTRRSQRTRRCERRCCAHRGRPAGLGDPQRRDRTAHRPSARRARVGSEAARRGRSQCASILPFAEQTGAIRGITRWVPKRAVARPAAWRADGRDVHVAVNPSTRDQMDLDRRSGWPTRCRRTACHPSVAGPPVAAAGRRAEDRPAIHLEHGRRRERRDDRAFHGRPRPPPRPARGRRGHRGRGDGRGAARGRLRPRAGLAFLEAARAWGVRGVDQAPYCPTIVTDDTFWLGNPPRLCVIPQVGAGRWRSPARPDSCRYIS